MKLGMEVGLGHIVRWGHSSPQKGGTALPPFWPMSVVAKRLDGSRCHLAWKQASALATLCLIRWGSMQLPLKNG